MFAANIFDVFFKNLLTTSNDNNNKHLSALQNANTKCNSRNWKFMNKLAKLQREIMIPENTKVT